MPSLQTLVQFLENPWYKYGFLSLCATAISLIVKLCSRHKTEVTREDWAVGFDLAQVAIFAILTDGTAEVVHSLATGRQLYTQDVVLKLVMAPLLLFFMVVFLFVLSVLVRFFGWTVPKPVHGVTGEPELNGFGVYAPIPFGLFYLVVSILWIGRS